ncbi:MAG: ABC transporter transmembrane domain-containing protein [Gammaproteobacteria bacterium]|nr:ABC transporter transmembrane domain-containing protein [Gammaproteobacteria bacterium]MDH5777028.1 ABC transporter transmembrane domain-containing protein [Gammaproteobacteria bacterium]
MESHQGSGENYIEKGGYFSKYQQRLFSMLHPALPDEAVKRPAVSFDVKRTHLVLASLSINLLALALPILTLQVYDRILVNENIATLYVLSAAVCVVVVMEGILRLGRSYVITWASAVYEHVIACNAMRYMLAADLSSLEQKEPGEQLQRMAGIAKLREFFGGQALTILIDLPFVFIFIGLIAYLAGILVLVPVVLLSLFVLIAITLGKELKEALISRERLDEMRMGFIIETLNGIHSVKSLGIETLFQRRYEKIQKEASFSNYNVSKQTNKAINYGALFTQGMIVGIISFGAPLAMQGQLTLGALIACVLLSGRIMQPVQRTLGVWTRYQDFKLALDKIVEVFELPSHARSSPAELNKSVGLLEIHNLSFSYGPNESQLFDNLNLKLYPGQSISITDDFSSGKTTLLQLMAGFYQPTNGKVLINGVESTRYPARMLIQHIGYLAMEGTIFRGTIWENLNAFGGLPDDRVYELVRLLGLDKEISKLPAGYETKLEGSTADPIPPGVKQRITIARVLASKPRIILFDNADRALDKEGYNQVYRLLARLKGKVTMIIVTNDRNIMGLAQTEYVLSNKALQKNETVESIKNYGLVSYVGAR